MKVEMILISSILLGPSDHTLTNILLSTDSIDATCRSMITLVAFSNFVIFFVFFFSHSLLERVRKKSSKVSKVASQGKGKIETPTGQKS